MKFRTLFLAVVSLYFASCSDDDISIPIQIADFSVTASSPNINEGDGSVTFNFVLPTATQTDIYSYDITGTAIVSEDYELPSTELSFTVSEGESTASISVTILDDDVVEDGEEETIILTLRERNGIVINRITTATVTIEDNDDFPFDNGFLISNRGEGVDSFGTVSYVNADFSLVQNEIYQEVNQGSDLGPLVNSIGLTDEFAYIISSNSDLITVVNRFTFEEVARITIGLNNPRHFVAIGDRGYVSNWGDPSNPGFIAVIDLTENMVIDDFTVGTSNPEQIEVNGTTLYVAHQGIVNELNNNVITVIDSNTLSIITTIGDIGANTNSMQLDGEGNLLVLSEGRFNVPLGESITEAKLSVISLEFNEVMASTSFGNNQSLSSLNIEGGFAYFLVANIIQRLNIDNIGSSVAPEFFLTEVNFFSNMNIIGDLLIGIDAIGGTVEAYDLTNTPPVLFGSQQEVGVLPNEVYMN